MKRVLPSFLLALGLACGGGGDSKVDQAVTIAQQIKAKPDDAEKVLGQHNMTPDQWEALMYEIASDPAMAEKFEAGLKK